MEDIKLPVGVPADRSKQTQYEPPRVIASSTDFENRLVTQDILIDDFEELVRLRLPYPTISYLALVTEYDFCRRSNS